MADFTIECFQNEFLPAGGTKMHAVVTVTATGSGAMTHSSPESQELTEIIVLDVSGSMTGERLQAAKVATSALIENLPDGIHFALVTGTDEANVAFPPAPPLAVSSPSSRDRAKKTLRKLEAGGGTAMSKWIELTAYLMRDQPGRHHAILLTDGKNEHDEEGALERALADATGVFECDCRGVGGDWEARELRQIAGALLGSYDIVPDPSGLTADFASMLHTALARRIGAVSLQVRTPQGGSVELLKQLEPDIDLTGSRIDVDPMVGLYPVGSWGDESRDYQLCVAVPPGGVGEAPMRAAQVALMVDDEKVGQVAVLAAWTDDISRSTRMNQRVAEVLGQSEMAAAVQEGIDAWRRDDMGAAADRLGEAVRLADAAGDQQVLDQLSKMVDWDDPETGRVKPKKKVDPVDILEAEVRSTRTSRTPKRSEPATPPSPTGPPAADNAQGAG